MRLRASLVTLALLVPAIAFAGNDAPPPKPDKTEKAADRPADKPADKPPPKLAADKPSDKPPTVNAATLQLQDVVARTGELKTKIRDARTALASISEEVFRTDTAGARTDVSLTNEMSTAYRLQHVVLLLDNHTVSDRIDESGSLADVKQLPLFSGLLTPGDHTFTLQLTFKGHGYGVFKYLEGYTFNVKSSHAVSATTAPISLTISAFEKGDQTTALDVRPTVEWREQVLKK
jgi:hypothetical protein